MTTIDNSNASTSTSTLNENNTSKENTVMSTVHTSSTVSNPAGQTQNLVAAANAVPPVPLIPPPAQPPAPVFIAPPPSANIPQQPPGFVPTTGNRYRGTRPKKAELVALPDAVQEIANYPNWETTMGAPGYPHDQVVEAFGAAQQWSTMRNATHQWDVYCRDQEGVVWTTIRAMMASIGPAFKLAVQSDKTLITRFPKLASFLGVKSEIAKKSVSTRQQNKKAVAAGEQPFHGAVGKKRKAAADKAALAAAKEQQPPHPAPQPTPAPAPAPAPAPGGAAAATAPSGTSNGAPPAAHA